MLYSNIMYTVKEVCHDAQSKSGYGKCTDGLQHACPVEVTLDVIGVNGRVSLFIIYLTIRVDLMSLDDWFQGFLSGC